MAMNWIKMRVDLYRDPKVIMIGDLLLDADGELSRDCNQSTQRDMGVTRNVTRNAAVGALLSIWGVCRHDGHRVGCDILVTGVTLSVLDDIAGLPGIGEAMATVGWAVQTDEGVVLPKFFGENNTDPADLKREKARERQRRHREKTQRDSQCDIERDNSVTVTHREEKRREEKSIEETNVSSCADQQAESAPPVIEFQTNGKQKYWPLTQSKVDEWQATYPGVDVLRECQKAWQWLVDNPERRKTARGMPAFLNRWLAKANDTPRKPPRNGVTPVKIEGCDF